MKLFLTDLNKYQKYSNKSKLVLFITSQGLWAIFVYRISNKIYKSNLPKTIKKLLLFFAVFWQKIIEIFAGISIPYSCSIGHSFYIGHFGGIIINANAVIGNNCNISQGVTIGVSGREIKRGVPIIGNNVYIGVNAVVAGKILIENNVLIAANSLVIHDVNHSSTMIGVPAICINNKGSKSYI
ncbi:Serine acetyltransferase [Polaribacter huanghezhanensis]|uniref:serine O-acetyltransferase n=1 Tax=Polaribacter huanghezhanensis TaxID=1354726 RepID=UPI00264A2CBD|nr:serine acetyltransferase [Polaribacter huanghezhanensis]WKD86510.1 Serine acetyltransferase [Polaribacter huanghezhanensis]